MNHPFASILRDLRGFYTSRRTRGRAALLLLVAGLGCGALHPAGAALSRLASAISQANDRPNDMRLRKFGAPWVEGVEALRHAVPRNGSYALVEAGPEEGGGALWLRYDLAPRKAVDLGRWEALAAAPEALDRLPPGIEWIAISHGAQEAPEILPRDELAKRIRARGVHAP